MSLRAQFAKLFAKPLPSVREEANNAARPTDQAIAADEKALQLKELQEAQQGRADEDHQAERTKAGLRHIAPHHVPRGMASSPPLRQRELETQAEKAVAAKHERERQMIRSKPDWMLLMEAHNRAAGVTREAPEEAKDKHAQKDAQQAQEAPQPDYLAPEPLTPAYLAIIAEWEAKIAAERSAPPELTAEEREARRDATRADRAARDAAYEAEYSHELDPGRIIGPGP